jgi:UDP-N-acetylglucosamine--N-acetylmuramyl-(pentapeptide) pyrophosphoryl-undecaprenol N-acetylglucosamine transferase
MNINKTKFTINPKPAQANFFYICGLTGGPYFPIPAIVEEVNVNFPRANNILIGVKNSYEQKLAESQNLNIEYLPKVKLDLLSFKNAKPLEIIVDLIKLVLNIFKFGFSLCKCTFLILKFRPIMTYSTGSFLAVPMVWATVFCNKIKLTNTKIVIHQQDASPGLANRFTAKFADLLSCTFEFTKKNHPLFSQCQLIPNPIIESKYNIQNTWHDKILETFIKTKSDKTLLLIFGGGTGALAVNSWVLANLEALLLKFRIIHLTGSLQTQTSKTSIHDNYFSQRAVFEDMAILMASVNLVICRAGLGSISELAFLNKLTFLIPIPDTHQVQNAKLILESDSNFHILDQNKTEDWLEQINNYANYKTFKTKKFEDANLQSYYQKLIDLIKLDQK